MRKKLLVLAICSILLIMNLLPVMLTRKASAVTTKLYLDPASITDETMTPGTTFQLTLKVSDVVGLFAYELKIYYLTSVINATTAVRPPDNFMAPILDPGNFFVPKWEVNNNFNATHGRIWLSYTLLAPEAGKDGSGILAQLNFKVTGIGSTPVTLSNTKLSDINANLIPHDDSGSFFSNAPPPPPPPPALIFVNPPSIIDPTLTPGSPDFSIDVEIINGTEVMTFAFKLNFDPSIIQATSIAEGSFLSSAGPTTVTDTTIDNTAGFVTFAVGLTIPGTPGANGNGVLATVTFHVVAMGATNLVLSDTSLINTLGEPLTHSTANGYFANVILAKMFVDPPMIIDPTLRPGDMFFVNISIQNVQNLYGYQFRLGYNTAVLSCIGVLINPVQGETGFTNRFSVDDGIGDIFVNVTYNPPANPISTIPPLAFVTLLFKIDGMGISNLALTDTNLIDNTGATIPHETQDGFIQLVTRDVAVLNVVPTRTWIYENRKVNVTVTVGNQGDFFDETFDVTLFFDNTAIGTITVHDLPIGQNTSLIFTWATTGLPPAIHTMKAEASSVPFETDLADNTFVDGTITIRITGDANGDGMVDIADMVIVAGAFGSNPSSPNWNPDADINEDGVVDILDLVLVAGNFGRHL